MHSTPSCGSSLTYRMQFMSFYAYSSPIPLYCNLSSSAWLIKLFCGSPRFYPDLPSSIYLSSLYFLPCGIYFIFLFFLQSFFFFFRIMIFCSSYLFHSDLPSRPCGIYFVSSTFINSPLHTIILLLPSKSSFNLLSLTFLPIPSRPSSPVPPIFI